MSDETQEPTLRRGNVSVDGWVEYAKNLLLETALKHNRTDFDVEDGRFDELTEWLVKEFQTDRGIHVDGIIGNQTWAELRGEVPQQAGTDGRRPGTYVEEGIEARWKHEDDCARIDPDHDQVLLLAFNTGSAPLNVDNFDVDITFDTGQQTIDVVDHGFVCAADMGPVADAGELFYIVVDHILSLTNASSYDDLAGLKVTARMGTELGGDVMDTTVRQIA